MLLVLNNFFLVPTLISILGLILIYSFRKKLFSGNKLFWISIVICFSIYLFFVGSSLIEDTYLTFKISSFTNDDGVYQYNKLNTEQKYYNERLINDLSRNFSVVFGLTISVLFAGVYFIIAQLFNFIKNNLNKNA